MTKPRPLGNRASQLVDEAIGLLTYGKKQIRDSEGKQDRQPDLAATMRERATNALTEAENLLLRVRFGQYEE